MSEKNLSTVALQTIANYRHAADQTVKAYRVGSQRLIHAISDQMNGVVYPRAEQILPKLSQQVHQLQGRAVELTTQGIDIISVQTGKLISLSADSATSQVGNLASRLGKLDSPYLGKGVVIATKINLPSAKLALVISEKLAAGADSLSSAVAGPIKVQVRAASRKPVAGAHRKLKAAAKPLAKRAATNKVNPAPRKPPRAASSSAAAA